uniref:Uncharacterized protein n=1 Tax=Setaria viridis TaxID=4556 RepID=A0A4U6UD70_SETVI|nr:hypothetical protein SEVIR_5G134700v2 [Setaria viridis]
MGSRITIAVPRISSSQLTKPLARAPAAKHNCKRRRRAGSRLPTSPVSAACFGNRAILDAGDLQLRPMAMPRFALRLSGFPGLVARDDSQRHESTKNSVASRSLAPTRRNGGAVLSCRGCVQPWPPSLSSVAAPSVPTPRGGAPPVLQDVVMEPQPGSPASPPSSSSPNSAEVTTTPSEEMPAPEEPVEDVEVATEQEPGRKSTSSSSSSSSASSAESLRHVDVVELGDTLVPAPEDEQAVAHPLPSAEGKPDAGSTLEDEQAAPPVESAGGKPDDGTTPENDHQGAATVHGAEIKPDDRALPEDEQAAGPAVDSAEVKPDDERVPPDDEQAAAPAVHSAEVKPDDWATWPEPPPPAVDYSFSSDGSAGSGAAPTLPTTEVPQVQTMPKLEGAAGASEFDPQRIPASVFQTRTSVSQAEWSMTSNESLFSIQGASDVGGPYAGSRSHFDFFYDEAMAAAAGSAESNSSKLPSVAEGTEPAESKEFAVPGSASSQASAGSAANAKKAAVLRHHESGSGGSSSNFSFAFPILAPTSPKKKDLVSSALYQPLEKEWEPQPAPPPMEPPSSAFVEMTTEAERRGSTGCCCCGCCWFDCSWSTCCGWWRCCSCSCCCSCPSFCRCSWCLCS